MNAQQFFQYIEHPDKLGIHEEVQLRGVLKEFPYFQSAHMLLAKCLKNMDNYTFEKQLRMAAVFSSNRAVMYQLLKSIQRPESHISQAHQVVSEAPVAKPAPLIPQPVDESLVEKPLQPILQSVKDSLDEEEEDVIITQEGVSEIHREISEPIIETIPTEIESTIMEMDRQPEAKPISLAPGQAEPDHLEKRRLEIAAQYEAFLKRKDALAGTTLKSAAEIHTPPKTASPEIVEEKPTETSEVTSVIPQTIEILEETVEPISEESEAPILESFAAFAENRLPDSESGNLSETHSFGEWLKLATASKNAAPEPKVETPAMPAQMEEKLETVPDSIQQTPVSRVDIDAILERFIHQNPSISRPKSEFFNPVKAAQKSLEDSGDLVTETLARMHEKQGNYQKAIIIYEKLSLKFPEKASIFAALITELKNKTN